MLMLAVSSIVMAQKDEVIYDICRAKFGDSFDTTKAALQKYMKDIESSFGSLAGVFPGTSCPEPWVIGDVIRYTHWGHSEKYFTIYDIVFDELYFSFSESSNPLFDFAMFYIECKTKREAKEKFKEVVEILKKRFTLYEATDDEGNEVYGGGTYYKNEDKCAFMVSIGGNDQKNVYLIFRERGF